MSVICINGKFENENAYLSLLNRGFLYSDGLFETMFFDGTRIVNLEDHMERLQKGLSFFDFQVSPLFFRDVADHIDHALERNLIRSSARVKLIVWRNTGGLYTPTQNSCSFVILCTKAIENNDKNIALGILNTPLLPHSEIGNHKTLNSLYYVLAGIEKKKSGLDDLIVLNTSSQICECTSSNLFWEKDAIIYTPSLETGCIAGIKRKQLIKDLRNEGRTIVEGEFKIPDLEGAHKFYLTNVMGIRETSALTK